VPESCVDLNKIRDTCKQDYAPKLIITAIETSLFETIYVFIVWLSSRPYSLNGLVKMQTAARSLSDELASATLLRWLRVCSVSGSKPGHAAYRVPHSSEVWRRRSCLVPAPRPNAVVWTGRAFPPKTTCCTIQHLTLVFGSPVRGCHHDLSQSVVDLETASEELRSLRLPGILRRSPPQQLLSPSHRHNHSYLEAQHYSLSSSDQSRGVSGSYERHPTFLAPG
jgi:hypothetical protein